MKYIKKFKESVFVSKGEVDQLLDKINKSGIKSLSDIEHNRLKIFSEEDKEIINTIEKIGDITNKFKILNSEMNRLSSEGKNDEAHKLMDQWMELNNQLRPLEQSFRKWGIELGDDRLSNLMSKVRPDAYQKFIENKESDIKPHIYKSPSGLIQNIKEIFYILSDYGCELTYDDSMDYFLEVEIIPLELNRSFVDIDGLINLNNRLKNDNDYSYSSKIIEVYSHLRHLREDIGGFNFKFNDIVSLDDEFGIYFDFDHDPKAILNDVDGKIYLNDDLISIQITKIYTSADYHSWEVNGNTFFLDFYLNKKFPIDSILNHYNSILGEYFKFYLDKEESDDFEESGDYYYTLKGDLIKGEMAPY